MPYAPCPMPIVVKLLEILPRLQACSCLKTRHLELSRSILKIIDKLSTAAITILKVQQLVPPMRPSLQLTQFLMRRLGLVFVLTAAMTVAIAPPSQIPTAKAETLAAGRALTVSSDIQEANTQTGVVTARGNVRIDYPARQIQATSAQAQYFSRERRIVLTGNVYVLQEGNTMRGETIVYLIDEGRFVAQPKINRQVESTYLVNDPNAPSEPGGLSPAPPFNPKPAFKTPESDPPPGQR